MKTIGYAVYIQAMRYDTVSRRFELDGMSCRM